MRLTPKRIRALLEVKEGLITQRLIEYEKTRHWLISGGYDHNFFSYLEYAGMILWRPSNEVKDMKIAKLTDYGHRRLFRATKPKPAPRHIQMERGTHTGKPHPCPHSL